MRRAILTFAGIIGALMGGLWLLQGLGVVHWPASSFMLDQRPWAIRGGILLAVSLLMIFAMRVTPEKSKD